MATILKKHQKIVTGLLTAVTLLAFVYLGLACDIGNQHTGVLEGRVSIGPIQPIERPGEDVTTPPEVYEARKVLVFNKNGRPASYTNNRLQRLLSTTSIPYHIPKFVTRKNRRLTAIEDMMMFFVLRSGRSL